MYNFALITCSDDSRNMSFWQKFCYILIEGFKSLFLKFDVSNYATRVVLYDFLGTWIINLPYGLEEMKGFSQRKVKRITKGILEFNKKNEITACLVDGKLKAVKNLEQCKTNFSFEYSLFKLLLSDILKILLKEKRQKLGDIDIAIVANDNNVDLSELLDLISSSVKYVTILTNDKLALEDGVNKLLEDTGLSVYLTSDFKNSLRSANLVVNFLPSEQFLTMPNINTKAVVINYSLTDVSKIFKEGILINNIKVGITQEIKVKLGENLLKGFDSFELAENIIAYLLKYKEIDLAPGTSFLPGEAVSKVLTKEGYHISGFVGRYSILGLGDVKV